jgi:hypothetical protein
MSAFQLGVERHGFAALQLKLSLAHNAIEIKKHVCAANEAKPSFCLANIAVQKSYSR